MKEQICAQLTDFGCNKLRFKDTIGPTTQVGGHQGAVPVHIYATADGRLLHQLELGGQETMCCDWSLDGSRLAIGGHDGIVRLLDTGNWQGVTQVRTAGEDLAHVYWVGLARDGAHLVTLGFEGLIVWRLADGARVAHFAAANGRPFHIAAWSPETVASSRIMSGTVADAILAPIRTVAPAVADVFRNSRRSIMKIFSSLFTRIIAEICCNSRPPPNVIAESRL